MTEIREKQTTEQVNPFTAIWLKTRKAVRYTIEAKSMGYAILLVVLAGIGTGLMGLQSSGLNDTVPTWLFLIGTILLFPVVGLIGTAITSAVYLVVGKLFKGRSTYPEMFKAIGAALIPYIWLAPLLLLWILIAPETYFADPFMMVEPSGAAIATSLIYGLFLIVISIWSIVIQSKAIGEAHQFSSWKGFFTILIPGLLIGLIIIVVAFLFFILLVGSGMQ